MVDIKLSDINTLVGPCLGKFSRQLSELVRNDEDHGDKRVTSLTLPAVAQRVAQGRGRPVVDTNQCPERFAVAALRTLGQSVDQQEVEVESAEVQRRLRWHLKR